MKKVKKAVVILLVLSIVFSTQKEISAKEKTRLNRSKKILYVGETTKLKLLNRKGKVKWKSSNKKVAEVSSKGKVKAKKKGKATITAINKGKKYKCKITVKKSNLDSANKSNSSTKNTSNTTNSSSDDVVEYMIGDTWAVDGQWTLTINSVTATQDRNEFSDKYPAEVYIVDYTYTNLGYISSYMDGLYMSFGTCGKIVDSAGMMGYEYPGDITYYPDETPVGATCNAQFCVGVDNAGSFKIYFDDYDGNGKKQSAVFYITV